MNEFNYQSAPPFFDEGNMLMQAKSERREIRQLGFYTGAAVLLYVFIQNMLVALMTLFGMYSQYRNNPLLQDSIDILLILASLLLPFLLVSKPMRNVSGLQSSLPLEFPQKGSHALLAVPAGVAVCLLANDLTSYLIALFGGLGVELTSPDMPMPGGPIGILISFLRVVVVATLTEELCFRGVVLQNLRRYGIGFAVFIAAAVFGLLHGNPVQTPFAFVVGLVLGWFAVITGTLWTGILIHGCNNLVSLLLSYLSGVLTDGQLSTVYLFLNIFLILIGFICLILYFVRRPRSAQVPAAGTLNGFWAKTGAFVSNPTMILALVYTVYVTSKFIQTAR